MLIDAHSHLDNYGKELESVLKEISEHRIFTISNSVDIPSYERNLEIASKCELVLPTFGVHPWTAYQYVERLEDLREAINQSPMLGELGLDYHWARDASQYPAQTKVFEFFLAAASQQGKIVNLHTKGAEKEVLQLLRSYDIQRAIIHWYSGPPDVFRAMIDQGFYFTVGVEVLSSQHIQTIARDLPLERLLTETDNPGGQQWLAGSPGMPHHIRNVIQKLAELRKATAQAIIETVQANFLRLIQDDPWLSDSCGRLFEPGKRGQDSRGDATRSTAEQ